MSRSPSEYRDLPLIVPRDSEPLPARIRSPVEARPQCVRVQGSPLLWAREVFTVAESSIASSAGYFYQIDEMALSEEIHEAGQEVRSATGAAVNSVLNRILNRFLGWPFRAAPGFATDRESKKTDTFGSVIYSTSDTEGDLAGPVDVPADALAAVIDVCESMDLEQFRAAYQRIGRAKTLDKTPAARLSGVAHTTTTLGIILAIRASLPLEKFAEELDRLNRETPGAQWPDMVAVLSTGTINYALQFLANRSPATSCRLQRVLPPPTQCQHMWSCLSGLREPILSIK